MSVMVGKKKYKIFIIFTSAQESCQDFYRLATWYYLLTGKRKVLVYWITNLVIKIEIFFEKNLAIITNDFNANMLFVSYL